MFAISFVIAVLLTAFYNTQVVRGETYSVISEGNRLRPVVIPAPRGTIYDRYGEVVATSIPGFSVVLLPGAEETIRETLTDLQPFLGLADSDVERLMRERAASPHGLLTITEDATFSQTAAIEERRASFPNLLIIDRPKRFYPAGPAIGHIIGYVSEITREELEMPIFEEAGYRQGRWIGKAGVERQYELRLAGNDGARFVEVDAMGETSVPGLYAAGSVAALTGEPCGRGRGAICGALCAGQVHDDPMTTDSADKAIDLDDDPDFERRDRVVTRVGMTLLTLFVLAAVLGLLGPGPLSSGTTTSDDGAIAIEHNAIGHIEADDSISLLLDGSTVDGDLVTVELTGSWVAGVDLTSISPAPAAQRLVPEGMVLEFDVERPGELEVMLHFRAKDLGRLALTAATGDSTVSLTQFVLP